MSQEKENRPVATGGFAEIVAADDNFVAEPILPGHDAIPPVPAPLSQEKSADFMNDLFPNIGEPVTKKPLSDEEAARIKETVAEHDLANEPMDRYTDAQMAGRFAREILAGKFVYTKSLGWLRWDGKRWAETSDETVFETARKWTLDGYLKAIEGFKRLAATEPSSTRSIGDDPNIKGWTAMQSLQRIRNAAMLARGIVLRNGSEFDTETAILNTQNGVVDLRTGEIFPHDPKRLITKITGAAYKPGAESPSLKAVLDALPDDAHDWLQVRLGEATTGRSSDQMTLLTGGGRNGKTLLMGAVYRTLGNYAAKVPNTLLMRTRGVGAATPEKMTLRGVRLAYMEETPEDSYLDAAMVKDLVEAEQIDGRMLYKNTITWKPTHSIFLNTNHPPTMADTGHGAWRRLARLDFPFRYRKADEAIERPNDRRGDPHLRERLQSKEGQEALLAWLVAGAMKVYAAGSLEDAVSTPASVLKSIQQWRASSDDILRFINDRMELDPDSWVVSSELYEAFSEWLKDNGGRTVTSKIFHPRLDGHTALPAYVEKKQLPSTRSGLSRAQKWPTGMVPVLPARTNGYIGLRFKTS